MQEIIYRTGRLFKMKINATDNFFTHAKPIWAKGLEKELSSMESKIQILMNSPSTDDTSKKQSKDESPVLDLFNEETQINGTRS